MGQLTTKKQNCWLRSKIRRWSQKNWGRLKPERAGRDMKYLERGLRLSTKFLNKHKKILQEMLSKKQNAQISEGQEVEPEKWRGFSLDRASICREERRKDRDCQVADFYCKPPSSFHEPIPLIRNYGVLLMDPKCFPGKDGTTLVARANGKETYSRGVKYNETFEVPDDIIGRLIQDGNIYTRFSGRLVK